ALPFSKTVVLARPLVDRLDHEELEPLLAHEIAHLHDSSLEKTTTLTGAAAYFPLFLLPAIIGSFGFWGYVGGAAWLVIIPRLLGSSLRRRETAVDQQVEQNGHSTAAYARALETIHRYNLMPVVGVGGRKATHPQLYQRYVAFLAIAFLLVAPSVVESALLGAPTGSSPGHYARMTLTGADADDFEALADRALANEDWERAFTFYGGCTHSDPDLANEIRCTYRRVIAAVRLGRCDEGSRLARNFAHELDRVPGVDADQLHKLHSKTYDLLQTCSRRSGPE
ncbi:MAG: M56 family metallopeptidase, partial [Bradymonadaceae bacterium]